MKISGVVVAVVGVVVTVVSLGAAVLRARQNPAASGLADGSVAALTAEVRALRLSIEDAAKNQQQVQGLGVYLSVQKDRLLQVTAMLASAQKDTAAAVEMTRRATAELSLWERTLNDPEQPADRRAVNEENVKNSKAAVERVKQAESEARNRESMAGQAAQTEEQRWNELIARLETLIRK
jgi:hypothetical protein